MKPGRPPTQRTHKRDHLETAQITLVSVLFDIDELILRNRQAMRRTGLVTDVLTPAIERLAQLRESIHSIQAEVREAWVQGQENDWKDDKKEDPHYVPLEE
jgi:hypothetical protein